MIAHSSLTLDLPDEAATDALGQALAMVAAELSPNSAGVLIPGPDVQGRIHLQGELGAGKTALVRAFLRHCSISGRIKSPSYALLESYEVSNLYFYHLDFYRFSENADWLDAGFRDLFKNNALILIEWPERAGNLVPTGERQRGVPCRTPGAPGKPGGGAGIWAVGAAGARGGE